MSEPSPPPSPSPPQASETSPPSPPPQQEPPSEFPPVDPTTFDLIILGTGLPQSIISAAASTAGKTVLHLDPNAFYGSHFSSLSPPHLSSFLLSSHTSQDTSTSTSNFHSLPLSSHPLYSDVELSDPPHELQEILDNKFCVDVSGPRVLFCADNAVNLLVKSGVSDYLEFKCVDQSLVFDGESGELSEFPVSMKGVFKEKLSNVERIMVGRFFKIVEDYLSRKDDDEGRGISEEELDSPFIQFLNKKKLPHKYKKIILYAIALADYDQEDLDVCKDLLKTKDGLDLLALYHSSVGRFPNAPGAMLYPMYGQGELPQAFCRRAAVKGCIYVLRMPVAAVLADKESGLYKGVRLASGQEIYSQQLLIDPQFAVPQPLALPKNSRPREIKKVARGICITRKSLKADASNLFIVCPPRSLYPEQATSVRALQLGSNSAVCPVDMFVLHLSTLCDDASQGKKLLNAAMNALLSRSAETKPSEIPEDNSLIQSAATEEQKPAFVWSALYIQGITEESVHTISSCPSPDGNLSYNNLVDITEKMFQQMFSGEEFFPDVASTEDPSNAEDLGSE